MSLTAIRSRARSRAISLVVMQVTKNIATSRSLTVEEAETRHCRRYPPKPPRADDASEGFCPRMRFSRVVTLMDINEKRLGLCAQWRPIARRRATRFTMQAPLQVARSYLRHREDEPQNEDVPPSPNTLSTASTPPARKRKVLPMCPVRNVTYVSGRSQTLRRKKTASICKTPQVLQTGCRKFYNYLR